MIYNYPNQTVLTSLSLKMYFKSKLIEKQIISNNSYNELYHFFGFHESEKKECHELLKTEVTGGLSSSYTKLITPKSGNDKCWFITSGKIIAVQKYRKKNMVVLLFHAGELAVLPKTFFNNKEPYCTLIACPDTHFIEISRDTVLKLQHLVSDPLTVINKITFAPFNNYIEKTELTSLPGEEAIIEFHNRYPEVNGPDRKIDLKDKYQASYLDIRASTFSKLKKEIELFLGTV